MARLCGTTQPACSFRNAVLRVSPLVSSKLHVDDPIRHPDWIGLWSVFEGLTGFVHSHGAVVHIIDRVGMMVNKGMVEGAEPVPCAGVWPCAVHAQPNGAHAMGRARNMQVKTRSICR